MTRQATDKILEMVEDDVADMAHSNEFFINEEEDEEEDE